MPVRPLAEAAENGGPGPSEDQGPVQPRIPHTLGPCWNWEPQLDQHSWAGQTAGLTHKHAAEPSGSVFRRSVSGTRS